MPKSPFERRREKEGERERASKGVQERRPGDSDRYIERSDQIGVHRLCGAMDSAWDLKVKHLGWHSNVVA